MSWAELPPQLRWLALSKAMPAFVAGDLTVPGAQKKVRAATFLSAFFPDASVAEDGQCPLERIWEWACRNGKEADAIKLAEWLISMSPESVSELLADSGAVMTTEERLCWAVKLSPIERPRYLDAAAAEWLARRDGSTTTTAMTCSQASAHSKLRAMGTLFFKTAGCDALLRPRFMPLLLGPTGAGKSSLLRRIAEELGAKFLRASGGEWIPAGAKDARPTVLTILDLLASNTRLVLMIDELDKMTGETNTSWSRSVQNELFAVLDRALPVEAYVKAERIPEPLAKELNRRVATGLFVCAAGTWQHLLDSPSHAGFGFQSSPSHEEIFGRVLKDRVVPKELLMRFTLPPIALEYPTQAETQRLYDDLGITRLARTAEYPLDPATHDWTRGGMRSLENLSAELLIRIHERGADR